MSVLPKSVKQVIEEFSKLPGIGPKSASRMAYHYLRSSNMDASKLANALLNMETNIKNCNKCFNVSESEECEICGSPLRKKGKICVVEEPLDVVAFEDSCVYDGVYFVLGGVISPSEGIGADELRFKELRKRAEELLLEEDSVEVIIATNPSLEGEATASYVIDIFKNLVKDGKVKITRLAMGLPTGADLEYADRLTLKKALEGRRDI